MIKLPKSQQKIIIATLAGVAALIVFWYFIYVPSQKQLVKIMPNFLVLENQAAEVDRVMSRTKTAQASVQYLKERFVALNKKLFENEARNISALSDLARRLNIEVVTVKPQGRQMFIDEIGQKLEFSGKTCQYVPVTIEIKCYYKDLSKYLQALRESFPGFVTVEKMRLIRIIPKNPRLAITLEIRIYVLS